MGNVKLKYDGERPVFEKEADGLHGIFTRHKARYKFIVEQLTANGSWGKVLDTGCGTGHGSHILAEAGCSVIGVDIAPDAIEYALNHRERDDIEFLVMNCEKLDFPEESFDGVASVEVLEHVPDYESYVKEISRVLKKGGRFVLTTPNVDYPGAFGITTSHYHVKEFTYDDLMETLQPHFSKVEIYGESVSDPAVIKWEKDFNNVRGKLPGRFKLIMRRVMPQFLSSFIRRRLVGPEPKLAVEDVVYSPEDATLKMQFAVVCTK